jgi:flagellar L-ring protein FlgH
MRKLWALSLLTCVAASAPIFADDLYKADNWPALAADRKASQIGDILTLLVVENNQASNSVTKGSRKSSSVNIGVDTSLNLEESASAAIGGSYEGQGSNGRTDRMVARLSVTVMEVYPNGDMRVSGLQRLKINGESTTISINGRVRPDDVTADNSVQSWRLADAVIDYDGKGFATRSAKPGILTKVFSWLGLL